MTVIKTAPVTPALATTQAEWHARQAAGYYAQSHNRFKAPQGRATARNRFVADAKLALPVMGLELFLKHFEAWLREAGWPEKFDEAKATIGALAAELALVPRTVAVAADSVPVSDALTNAKSSLAAALAKVDEALRLVELTGDVGAVEAR